MAVTAEPSSSARSWPVSPSKSSTPPWWASRPFAGFPGKMQTAFRPYEVPRLGAVRGHQAEQALLIRRPDGPAQRLPHPAAREVGERLVHQLDALAHRQQPPDVVVGEDEQLVISAKTLGLTRRAPAARAGAGRAPRAPARGARAGAGRRRPTSPAGGPAPTRARASPSSTPRSAAAASNASSASNVRSVSSSEYGSGRRVIREPAGYASPRRYLPVSQPPASGLNGVNPSPSRSQIGSTSVLGAALRAGCTRSAPTRSGRGRAARSSRAPPRAAAPSRLLAPIARIFPERTSSSSARSVSSIGVSGSGSCVRYMSIRSACSRSRLPSTSRRIRSCDEAVVVRVARDRPVDLRAQQHVGASLGAPAADPGLAAPAAVRGRRVEDGDPGLGGGVHQRERLLHRSRPGRRAPARSRSRRSCRSRGRCARPPAPCGRVA